MLKDLAWAIGLQISKKQSFVYRQCDQIGRFISLWATFKASYYFAQIALILGNFCKGVKIFHFSSEISFGQIL